MNRIFLAEKELYVLQLVVNGLRIVFATKLTVFLVSLRHYLLGFRLNAPVLEVHNVS